MNSASSWGAIAFSCDFGEANDFCAMLMCAEESPLLGWYGSGGAGDVPAGTWRVQIDNDNEQRLAFHSSSEHPASTFVANVDKELVRRLAEGAVLTFHVPTYCAAYDANANEYIGAPASEGRSVFTLSGSAVAIRKLEHTCKTGQREVGAR